MDKALDFNLSAIAITDHDTVKGTEPAKEYAKGKGLKVIPGVELSCIYKGIDVHILGYFKKPGIFEERLLKFQRARIERAEEMVRRLSLEGVKIDMKRVLEIAENGAVGRPHIAQVLVEEGYANSIDDAFARFIGYHCKAYVPKLRMSIEEGIDLIKEFKGVSVLAHPAIYNNKRVIEYCIDKGIEGIEVWHPEHSKQDIEEFLELAKRKGLLITGGSDSHGGRKKQDFFGKIKIEEKYLEKLEERLTKSPWIP